MKRPRHKLSSTDGIDYIQKQKSVKVNTERLGDIDRFPFPHVYISVDGGAKIEVTIDRFVRISADEGEHKVLVIMKSSVED